MICKPAVVKWQFSSINLPRYHACEKYVVLHVVKLRFALRGPSGVRAQALAPTGDLVDDFLVLRNGRMLNVCNAPSPAATASLNIGKHIVDRLEL